MVMDSTNILFWNAPPKRDDTRAVDPLGFDALREVMADGLAPLLTGATRHADEYLWTLIGLRVAPQLADSTVDDEFFAKGFAPFERALKQYWLKFESRRSGGVNTVEELIEGKCPTLSRPILADERATGLVGSYIVSLRGLGLIESNSLRVCSHETDKLLAAVEFNPKPTRWASSWKNLEQTFSQPDLRAAKRRLGRLLFATSQPLMNAAARAVRRSPSARDWHQVRWDAPGCGQARVAKATESVAALGKTALLAFADLLKGDTSLPPKQLQQLRRMAERALQANPYPDGWATDNRLRRIMDITWSRLADGKDVEAALVELHVEVTRGIRQTDPWIERVGERSESFADWEPGRGAPDYRFANLFRLLIETGWKSDAH